MLIRLYHGRLWHAEVGGHTSVWQSFPVVCFLVVKWSMKATGTMTSLTSPNSEQQQDREERERLPAPAHGSHPLARSRGSSRSGAARQADCLGHDRVGRTASGSVLLAAAKLLIPVLDDANLRLNRITIRLDKQVNSHHQGIRPMLSCPPNQAPLVYRNRYVGVPAEKSGSRVTCTA